MTKAKKARSRRAAHAHAAAHVRQHRTKPSTGYRKNLGAKEISRSKSPDGKQIMHAEIQIGDSRIYVNDAMGGGRSARGAT